MEVNVKADVKGLTKELNRIQRKQIPFATANAINDTAVDVRTALYHKMNAVFHKPTSFTVPRNIEKASNRQGSLYMMHAKKGRLSAKIFVKDGSTLGVRAIRWLEPQIKGGARHFKGSERALRGKGVIGGNKFITPSTKSAHGSVSLNKFGNVTKGMMTKILSGVSAGFFAGTSSRQSTSYFAMRLGGKGSETGIWQRTGATHPRKWGKRGRLKKLFNVTDTPSYRPRLPFDAVGRKAIAKNFEPNFERQMKHALRTAR
jgi:hypothetical protein